VRDTRSADISSGEPPPGIYLTKAQATLAGAELELRHGYYNNAVNRAYYAAYQAAVGALIFEGIVPILDRFWPHDVVQAQFPALLVDERCRYPRELRATLKALFDERLKADYEPDLIDPETAAEAVRRAREFVGRIMVQVGGE
jgi:uncharacterized protein (UPF0332 family)